MALCSWQKDPHAVYSTAYNIGFVPEVNEILSDILILSDADTNLTYVSLHLYIADNSCLCHWPALLHENNIQRLTFQIMRNYTTPCVFPIQLGKQKIRNVHTHFYSYAQHSNVLCVSVVSQLIYLNSFAINCNNEPPHEVPQENLMKRGKKPTTLFKCTSVFAKQSQHSNMLADAQTDTTESEYVIAQLRQQQSCHGSAMQSWNEQKIYKHCKCSC